MKWVAKVLMLSVQVNLVLHPIVKLGWQIFTWPSDKLFATMLAWISQFHFVKDQLFQLCCFWTLQSFSFVSKLFIDAGSEGIHHLSQAEFWPNSLPGDHKVVNELIRYVYACTMVNRWFLFSGLDYWTDIFLVSTHVVVSLIDFHW